MKDQKSKMSAVGGGSLLRVTGMVILIAMVLAESGCGSGSAQQQAPPPPPPPPALSISTITPPGAAPGIPDLTLIIVGGGFSSVPDKHTQVVWSVNGITTPLVTTFVSSTELTAVIPAALLKNPVTAQVLVQNLDIDGVVRTTSNSVSFRVTTPSPGTPSISSLSPMSATAGGPDLTLNITGSNFSKPQNSFLIGSQAIWVANSVATQLVTTFVSSTTLTAVIPAALLKNPVTAQVLVQALDILGDGAGPKSNPVSFIVTAATASHGYKATGSLVGARAWHSATLLPNGMVLVAGGADHLGVLGSAELYDPTRGTFTSTGNLVAPRQGHAATLIADGKVLIAGGKDNVGPIGSAELYDPATGRFSPVGNMNNARWSHTATLLANGKVLIAGGTNNTDSQNSAELFDPATGNFTAIENMIYARMHHAATPLANGKVLLVGGSSSYSPITSLASAELFDPATNTFTSVGSMRIPRYLHKSSLLTDGKVLILGGSEHQLSVSSIEVFDPASETFVEAGSLSAMRTSPTVTLLPSGEVLIVGGSYVFPGPDAPESTSLASSELYAPASRSSMFTGALENSRVGHTATLLNNGAVLVVGGADDAGTSLTSVELFR